MGEQEGRGCEKRDASEEAGEIEHGPTWLPESVRVLCAVLSSASYALATPFLLGPLLPGLA